MKKLIYSTDDLLKLSRDELLNIVSILTNENNRVFFNTIEEITKKYIILNNNTNIEIISDKKYIEIKERYEDYQIFIHTNEKSDVMNKLISLESNLIKHVNDRLDLICYNITTTNNKIKSDFNYNLNNIKHNIINEISSSITSINKDSTEINSKVKQLLENITLKLENIKDEKFNLSVKRLEDITNMLSDVVL